MTVEGVTVECPVYFRTGRFGAREMRPGAGTNAHPPPPARTPKIARQMALALRFEGMLHRGEVGTQEDIARLGQVTQAYVSRIMGLLNLAPDLQEALLFWPRVEKGRPPVKLRDVEAVLAEPAWKAQRARWRTLGWPLAATN